MKKPYLRIALIAFVIAALIAIALVILNGCAPDAVGASRVAPNSMTPGGVPVHETEAMRADPAFESALFAEIDAVDVPPRYVVVLFDSLTVPGDGWRGYTDWDARVIRCGTSHEPQPTWDGARLLLIPALPHEVEHAVYERHCTPDGFHSQEPECRGP